jgi:hypothetical protein
VVRRALTSKHRARLTNSGHLRHHCYRMLVLSQP